MKHLLILLSFLLLPISEFGFDWTVSYHIKNSYGFFEFVELSVPEDTKGMWELPNLESYFRCFLIRIDYEGVSSVNLGCRSKESEYLSNEENIILNSSI